MTATTLSQDAQSTPAAPAPRTSRALTARRAFLIASPVLAGALAVVGSLADPAAGLTGRDMLQLYIDNPDPLQLKSFGFRWSYAFWIIPALLLVPYVRGKGAWLANVAGLLGFVGVSTLPGLLISDYFDSAVGQVGGIETALEVQQLIGTTMWGMPAITTPGMIGFMLALPLAAVAAWRAGLVRWVAPVAVVAAQLAFLLSNVTWWGCVITLLCFVGFAVEVARGTAAHRVA